MKNRLITEGKFLPVSVALLVSSLFCLNFYFFITSRKVLKKNENQQAIILNLKKEKEALEKQLSTKKGDVEYYKQQRQMLDQMIEKQKIRPKKKKPSKNKDVKV